MQGNKSKMILFTLQALPIKNQKLFTYIGEVKINKIIVANKDAKRIFCEIRNVDASWTRQNWSMNIEADTWDNFKNKAKKGKISKTKYNLPDYDLPEVDKTKIKKTKRRTTTYTGGGSSGGSGGY